MDQRIRRAHQFLSFGRVSDAQRVLQDVLSTDPRDLEALTLLSRCAVELGDTAEAQRFASEAIAAHPDDPEVWLTLAEVELHRNRPQQASEAAIKARALDPTDERIHAALALAALRRAKWSEALSHTDAGLSLAPEDSDCTQFRILALRQLGRTDEADALSRAALRRRPEDPNALANAGWNSLNRGDAKAARELFVEALRKDPENQFAKQGLLEALRAGHWFYRPILRYRLWMSRLPTRWQMGVLVGGYLLFRGGVAGADRESVGGVILLVGVVAYLIFALSSWFASEIADGLLSLSRVGRLVRSRGERLWAWTICVLLLAGTGLLGAWWFEWFPTATLFLGLFPILTAMPLSAGSELRLPSARARVLAYAAGCAAIGAYAIVLEQQLLGDLKALLTSIAPERIDDPTFDLDDPGVDPEVSAKIEQWRAETAGRRGLASNVALAFSLLCAWGSQILAGWLAARHG